MSEESQDPTVRQVTHDIKNTLAVITMRCDECLKNPDLSPSLKNNIEQIKIAVESVSNLSKKLTSSQTPIAQTAAFTEYSSSSNLSKNTDHPKILVAEDESQLRRLISTALRSTGYEVIEAPDGAEAWEIFQKLPHIDLVITDMTMPKMNGFTLSQNIMKKNSDSKILFLSGADRFAEYGFSEPPAHFLEKPFPRDVLLEKVKVMLSS